MPAQLGLKENWQQFTLLVIVNAFVGGMVGLERTILPEIAETEFGVAGKTAILSFIVVFGITKAITNYYMGAYASRWGRKRLLVLGWLIGIPVPLILIYAPTWSWVVGANILLGINQGLTWSSTVIMKIDLVGDRQRGLAMGINESAGYLAVGAVAFLTGWIASEYGIRPYPFYLGIGLASIGLLVSWGLVNDTREHVEKESRESSAQSLTNVFSATSWKNRQLGSITQAGLVNNLNDGLVWGLLPVLLISKGFDLVQTGKLVALYPIVWGAGQLFTGKIADHVNKKMMLFVGMALQALSLSAFMVAESFQQYVALAVLLGLGTAIVYPTFLAAIAENTHPGQRAASIGVFRFWRDLGYAIGALLTGIIADSLSLGSSFYSIAIITFLSSLVILLRME